jgi:hypothetical protein
MPKVPGMSTFGADSAKPTPAKAEAPKEGTAAE